MTKLSGLTTLNVGWAADLSALFDDIRHVNIEILKKKTFPCFQVLYTVFTGVLAMDLDLL